MTSFNKIDVRGHAALALLQRMCDNDIAKPVGRMHAFALRLDESNVRLDGQLELLGEVIFDQQGKIEFRLVLVGLEFEPAADGERQQRRPGLGRSRLC